MKFKRRFLQDLGVVLGILIVLGVFVISAIGFTDPPGTTKVLTQMGYTRIVITGVRPFARGENEYYSTGFMATSPTGVAVSGVVTKGFRGSTVRWD
jgi:hypothetical protein